MKTKSATLLAFSVCLATLASAIPLNTELNPLEPRKECENTATSRGCWGNYSIDTDWYETVPNTGVTREYWLSVTNKTMALDGYRRQQVLSFNGTVPGPLIWGNWGDNMVIHVTNNMENNGTSIHWHGMRQMGSGEFDGVPGVTQCPIAPGDSYTYRFQATQYGSTWYHSHFITQYGDGLQGPMIINGPATANYDEDLGMLHLIDWSHIPVSFLWNSAKHGGAPTLSTGLINGTNTFNCTGSPDVNCIGGGKKWETVFEAGKKYRIRLINGATDGHFQFSIDGHSLTVIGMDLVPLVPYTTDSVNINMGQRYDVIVEANAVPTNYWLRAGWISACAANRNPQDITGIVRYSSNSTSNPTSINTVQPTRNCGDEPLQLLVPHLPMNVGNFSSSAVSRADVKFAFGDHFTWTINSSTLFLDWKNPTMLRVHNTEKIFPTKYNVMPVEITAADPTWVIYVIQDLSGAGITHPIHLHGHDFWVIGQEAAKFDLETSNLNLINPPRRDVASLPGNGYLAMAFKKDNPGTWLMHCHIAWHASQGLAMQFVESESQIEASISDPTLLNDTCTAWNSYTSRALYDQDDSGI
ncbi:probable Laccase-2 [Rhynchosporium secalis]|uniref:laccase n=1 Tax=Rhynchosporium secalis TaxID=38038 RepID=A0A1E1LWH9_RHYSE|nr:probable Laccase-2 [Rhynchosporium secalis]